MQGRNIYLIFEIRHYNHLYPFALGLTLVTFERREKRRDITVPLIVCIESGIESIYKGVTGNR